MSGTGKVNSGKADDLLSAAVTAFTAITRPARNDIQQLEDLAMPLLESATARGKRHVAAVLSQLDSAPRNLILALCDEAVEIAAPLLLRSSLLTSDDLVDIIASRGLGHARAIARRPEVDGIVQGVLESFADPAIDRSLAVRKQMGETTDTPLRPAGHLPLKGTDHAMVNARQPISALEGAMAGRAEGADASPVAGQMIDTALLRDQMFFRNLLADMLGVTFEQAQAIIGQWPSSRLPLALKALGLSAEASYLIMTAVLGRIDSDRNSLRDFVYFYRSIDRETALGLVRRGQADDITAMLRQKLREMAIEEEDLVLDAANSDDIAPLKAAR
ncbi:DUF2336 domain-containing protein [Phyllobacterium leguminum]|nr:DUF2336 domain-containing protein [Phyllobacterium leguminum]